jgi:hypothetical protein
MTPSDAVVSRSNHDDEELSLVSIDGMDVDE